MPLETTPGAGFLAALFPPGNLAAEILELRRRILRSLDGVSALPFPAAVPLAWLPTSQDVRVLEALAAGAPRSYDRYRIEESILFLGPRDPDGPGGKARFPRVGDGPEASPRDGGPGGPPLPAGAGFPLVILPPGTGDRMPGAGLPPPPRVAFRTFQAVLLRLAWGDPWFAALAWEPLASARYPCRREPRSDGRIPRDP